MKVYSFEIEFDFVIYMPKLPIDILRMRVQSELTMCQRKLPHKIKAVDPEMKEFPVEVRVILIRTPGPIWKDGKVSHLFTHTADGILKCSATPRMRLKS